MKIWERWHWWSPYNNYTNLSANLERGRAYELTIQAEISGTNSSIAAWIDFNGNNSLDDEGERAVSHISSDETSQEITVQCIFLKMQRLD
ncbi:MAG: hypothetical protein R2764_12990 [Bacteroidales bacterium]